MDHAVHVWIFETPQLTSAKPLGTKMPKDGTKVIIFMVWPPSIKTENRWVFQQIMVHYPCVNCKEMNLQMPNYEFVVIICIALLRGYAVAHVEKKVCTQNNPHCTWNAVSINNHSTGKNRPQCIASRKTKWWTKAWTCRPSTTEIIHLKIRTTNEIK